jgi:ubiquinone/menaquinone biosynthesis C-methylase UbiE
MIPSISNDLTRLRIEYKARKKRLEQSDAVAVFNLSNLFIVQSREVTVQKLLQQYLIRDLKKSTILEIGCGGGGVLIYFLQFGLFPEKLHGIDILSDRLVEAKKRVPTCPLLNADGQGLPFYNCKFDLVLQFTAFTSILTDQIKQNMASEML